MNLEMEYLKQRHIIHNYTFGCSRLEDANPITINYVISAIQNIEVILESVKDNQNLRNEITQFLTFACDELFHMAMLSRLENVPAFHRDYFCELGERVSDDLLFAEAMVLMNKIMTEEESSNQVFEDYIEIPHFSPGLQVMSVV